MAMRCEVSYEEKRGCGYRKPSKDGVGIYLMGSPFSEACERLPFPLTTCPCCGAGIGFQRAWRWIDPQVVFAAHLDPKCDGRAGHRHDACVMCTPSLVDGMAGLKWIGEQFYSPHAYIREARDRGISMKIPAIPHGFEIGKTFVYIAHTKAYIDWGSEGLEGRPGVFMVFRPVQVDLVVDDLDDIPDKARHLAERLGEDNCRIVQVVKKEPQQLSFA